MEYRVEELAGAAGLPVDTIRFYQGRGLLPAPRRVGRTAVYDDAHLVRLRRIRALVADGIPLALVKRLLEQAAVAKCAEMVGGADWVVETTVAYAKERVQYGRPIGSFGSIQHALAEMWTEVTMARRLTYYAAWAIEQQIPCSMQVAMAKATANEAYKHSTRMAVQLHGAIGTTRDHDVGLYYRRSRQAALLFGDSDFYREKVAQEVGL
jgi:alkylation response protein AidB-like acyl-CoA dehydrogenase